MPDAKVKTKADAKDKSKSWRPTPEFGPAAPEVFPPPEEPEDEPEGYDDEPDEPDEEVVAVAKKKPRKKPKVPRY